MNMPTIFDYHGIQVRTVLIDDEPWFVLKDVCEVLGLRAPDVKQRLSDDVVSTHTVLDSLGRQNTASIINEDGLYDTILESRKPEARIFRKWVTGEVLPSIRQTGSYQMQNRPKTQAELALAMAETLVAQERKISELEQGQRAMQSAVAQLTDNMTAIPDSAKVVDLVNEFARFTRLGHNEIYNKVYEVLKDQHGIDVRTRVANERERIQDEYHSRTGKWYAEKTLKDMVNGMDVMVRIGCLDKFHSILSGMLSREKIRSHLSIAR